VFGIPAVSDRDVDRVAGLETEERTSRLHGAVEVGSGKRELRQAEGVCGIGLLRGNYAASWPLTATIGSGECYSADDAVAVDDGAPHIQVEAAIGRASRRGECSTKLTVRGKKFARS